MLIFYTGRGLIVPVATFVVSLVSELSWIEATGDKKYYQNHGLPIAIALVASSIIIYVVHATAYKNKYDEDGRLISKEQAKWMDHTLLFIDIRVYSAIWIIWAIIEVSIRGI